MSAILKRFLKRGLCLCVCASPLYLLVFAKEEQYRYGNMKTISLFLIFFV